jgi:type VI secretion system protein ImpK
MSEALLAIADAPVRSYLVDQFRAFYANVLRRKKQVAELQAATVAAADQEDPDAIARAAHAVRSDLLRILQNQSLEAQRMGGRYAQDVNQEAQYLMAALGDEVLLNFEWPGKAMWTSLLLETALYESRVAGERVFERLEELLRTRDPARRDLALLYLLALSVGFQGKFRETADAAPLQEYRRDLYRFLFQREPQPCDPVGLLAPEAYAHTVSDARGRLLAPVRWWVVILALVSAALFGLSVVLWHCKTERLRNCVNAILTYERGTTSALGCTENTPAP